MVLLYSRWSHLDSIARENKKNSAKYQFLLLWIYMHTSKIGKSCDDSGLEHISHRDMFDIGKAASFKNN